MKHAHWVRHVKFEADSPLRLLRLVADHYGLSLGELVRFVHNRGKRGEQ
jgi:hypothetical protein